MIIVCELLCRGGTHVPFNAGMLEIVRAGFPDEEIVFLAEGSHMEQVQRQAGPSVAAAVSWEPIVPPPRGAGSFRRIVFEAKIIRNVLRLLRRNPRGHALFTNAGPRTLTILKLFERFLFRGACIQAVLHGQLGMLNARRSRNPIRRLPAMKMSAALRIFGKSAVQILVLEEEIRKAALKEFPSLGGRLEVLEHPLPPNERGTATKNLSTPLCFGFLGLANRQRGFPAFVKLASQMHAKHRGRAEFHAVGRLPNQTGTAQGMDALSTKPSPERPSRESFVQVIKQLHYIIFPYEPGGYELSTTGTLMDAIAWEKPIIARRMPLFENLFGRFGDVGYLYSDEVELQEIVENIVKKPDGFRYRNQILNLRKAGAVRSPAVLAATYRELHGKVRDRQSGDELPPLRQAS